MPDAYHWSHPFAWLIDASREWDAETLRARFLELAERMDSDELQDLYQSYMEQSCYFDPLRSPDHD